MWCFIMFLLLTLNWRLLCVLYIVMDFNVLQAFLDFKWSIQRIFKLNFKDFDCKYEKFSWKPGPSCLSIFPSQKNGTLKLSPGHTTVIALIRYKWNHSLPCKSILYHWEINLYGIAAHSVQMILPVWYIHQKSLIFFLQELQNKSKCNCTNLFYCYFTQRHDS